MTDSKDFLRNRIRRVLDSGLRQEPEEIGMMVEGLTHSLIREIEEWMTSDAGSLRRLLALEGKDSKA